MSGRGEVRSHDRRDLRISVSDAGHAIDSAQVVNVCTVDPTVGRNTDDQVEGENYGRDRQERVAERHRLGDERQRHERRGQEGEEHPAASEGLVVGEGSGREQAPVLGGHDLDGTRIGERHDRFRCGRARGLRWRHGFLQCCGHNGAETRLDNKRPQSKNGSGLMFWFGTAYRIRTGDLRLERAVSWASRRMRLRSASGRAVAADRDDTNHRPIPPSQRRLASRKLRIVSATCW